MRKTCNIVFISSIALIILSAIAPIIGLTNQFGMQTSASTAAAFHFLIIFFSSIFSSMVCISILFFIFILSLIGYLLTFGKYVKWKITNFKVLNSISDFLWLLSLGINAIMSMISYGSHSFFITYTLISFLTLAKIIYDIYFMHIKKGAFDNNKVIEEIDNIEFSEPIEADYQISEEINNDESNLN